MERAREGATLELLVREARADGVHRSYDAMTSLLAPYGSQAALVVARNLGPQLEQLPDTAAMRAAATGAVSVLPLGRLREHLRRTGSRAAQLMRSGPDPLA